MSSDIGEILKTQRRRRRLWFWGGFLIILVLGGLWAGLSKDARGPELLQGQGVVGHSIDGGATLDAGIRS